MRRDVRLLGDVLGEVISESDGPDLLADVERLRRAVIEARRVPDRGSPAADAAADEIAALVASWSHARAEQVARAFTVYFHLVNLAEEQQRVRTLRERDSGDKPPRESLADTIAQITDEQGRAHVAELLAGLRVHPVFTAHPTEARRRAVVASLRRVIGPLGVIDDQRAGAAQQAEARRQLREEVDLLWRTAQLRVKGMTPADEVRTVMTAFDETLFRLVPAVYRAMDHVLLGADSGRVPSPAPGVPAVRQLGRRRPGRQPHGHRRGDPRGGGDPGRPRAARAGGRLHPDRPGADRHRRVRAAVGGTAPGAGGGVRRPSGPARRDLRPLAARALPHLPAIRGRTDRGDPHPPRRSRLRRAGRVHRRPAPGAVVARGGRGGPAGVRGTAAPDLAGRDLRVPPGRAGGPAALPGARPGAGRAARVPGPARSAATAARPAGLSP